MADTGWITCGTGVNVTSIGTLAWTNPGRINSEDASSATVATNSNGAVTNYAQATNFSFALPSGSTILGIEARAKIATSNAARTWTLSTVRLVKAGAVQATNRGPGSAINFTGLAFQSFGGAADLWGDTWQVSDVSATNFGVVFSATCNASQNTTISFDVAQMLITYDPPLTTQALRRPRIIQALNPPITLGI
jgi:hypothetical protein